MKILIGIIIYWIIYNLIPTFFGGIFSTLLCILIFKSLD